MELVYQFLGVLGFGLCQLYAFERITKTIIIYLALVRYVIFRNAVNFAVCLLLEGDGYSRYIVIIMTV
jgi:hypothetical protein